MITQIWFFQVILAVTSSGLSTELLPEKYLKPKNFNYHPFTDVGIPASLKKALKSTNPYAILSKKRPREGREFLPENIIIYPTPQFSVTSRKYLQTNEIDKYDNSYVNVPKNYAFSYIVKDKFSGDDFSHSQAHNGKATKGQYRVKLPDGRTQIVNYMADHKGYRADVHYEEELVSKLLIKPLFHSVPQTKLHNIHQTHQNGFKTSSAPTKSSPAVVFTAVATPYNYLPSSTAASVQYVAKNSPLNLAIKPTVAPEQYQLNYASTTGTPFIQQELVTSTAAPFYIPEQSVSFTPLHAVSINSANAKSSAYHDGQYRTNQAISFEHSVIVTPKPAYNNNFGKNEPRQSVPLYYRLL